MYKVNKEKCLGVDMCGVCMQNCPGATQKGRDGKAKIIDQEKLEKCGGESVCPMRAIEKIDEGNHKSNTQTKQNNQNSAQEPEPEKKNFLENQRGRGHRRGKHLGKNLKERQGRRRGGRKRGKIF